MSKPKPNGKVSRTSARRRNPRLMPRRRDQAPPAKPFPIVGLGASAGGLEALEEFFTHLSPGSGMGFVVVTHQHPGHTSLLPELLGKRTRMPVMQARDGERVEPNKVYLSSPDEGLAILNGALQFTELKRHDGVNLPIDHFFRALAEDQGDRAVGIVLSGTGTDGTLGLKAIKGAGGMTMAQEPSSAKYSGMPKSAIATGAVDYVLRPKGMPEQLLAYGRGPFILAEEPGSPGEAVLPEPMQKIVLLLRSRTGHDFSAYKTTTIRRRIERRMHLHGIKATAQYLHQLQENPHELDLLFKELLIGVTSFFRDPEAFEELAKQVLPRLLEAKPADSTVRVWVPGCSTGEEAYSLAMLLQEGAERMKKRLTIQIFGTDLDDRAIEIARTGLYSDGIAVDVPPELLGRYFTKEDGGYRIRKGIREMVVFAPQNVIKDPLFTKLDLLSCRNLLIYLKPDTQKRLFSLFHYALKPGGALFLGPSESLGDANQLFEAVNKKWKIFARKESPLATYPLGEIPAAQDKAASDTVLSKVEMLQAPATQTNTTLEKLLANRFVPASVIINARGDVSYIHGRTGDYLEPAAGRPRLNILEMAREGLRHELASAIRRAAVQDGEVVREADRVQTNGGANRIKISVVRLSDPESLRGLLLVTFRPLPILLPGKAKKPVSKKQESQVQVLEQELFLTRESLQSTVEELQSANEELQSTNEELQSTNEELETSKEEMQSLNEELQTVNAQLQTKVDALSQTSDDMQNLLNGTDIATIFLDSHLKIKRFTEQARTVINLIPTDVGRPIGDLVSNVNYDKLSEDADEVLRTLNSREREVQTKQGGWRLVRIMPYRTTENMITGLVITFVDINRIKEAERAAQRARAFAESIVATVREPMLVLDGQLRVVSASQSFYRFFRTTRAEVEHHRVYDLGNRQWNIPKLRKLLERILPRNSTFEDFKVTHDFPRIGRRELVLNARRLQKTEEKAGLILLSIEDRTAKVRKAGKTAKGK